MVAMRPLFLTEKLERALLRDKAKLLQAADSLQASRMLAAAHDTSSLCLHQVLASQTTGRTLSSSMENLGLCATCRELTSRGCHFYILT